MPVQIKKKVALNPNASSVPRFRVVKLAKFVRQRQCGRSLRSNAPHAAPCPHRRVSVTGLENRVKAREHAAEISRTNALWQGRSSAHKQAWMSAQFRQAEGAQASCPHVGEPSRRTQWDDSATTHHRTSTLSCSAGASRRIGSTGSRAGRPRGYS